MTAARRAEGPRRQPAALLLAARSTPTARSHCGSARSSSGRASSPRSCRSPPTSSTSPAHRRPRCCRRTPASARTRARPPGSMSVADAGAAVRQVCAQVRGAVPRGGVRRARGRRRRPAVADGVVSTVDGARQPRLRRPGRRRRPRPGRRTASVADQALRPAPADRHVAAPGRPARQGHAACPGSSPDLVLPGQLWGRVVRPPSVAADPARRSTTPPSRRARRRAPSSATARSSASWPPTSARRTSPAERLRAGVRVGRDADPARRGRPGRLPARRAAHRRSTSTSPATPTVDVAVTPVRAPTRGRSWPTPRSRPSCGAARWDGRRRCTCGATARACSGCAKAIAPGARTWPAEHVVVEHVEGAGSYGHNGADDAAFDAVLLARAVPGRPVHVRWSRADELTWSPFGSPMVVDVTAGLDAAGRLVSWESDVWSQGHTSRPGFASSPGAAGRRAPGRAAPAPRARSTRRPSAVPAAPATRSPATPSRARRITRAPAAGGRPALLVAADARRVHQRLRDRVDDRRARGRDRHRSAGVPARAPRRRARAGGPRGGGRARRLGVAGDRDGDTGFGHRLRPLQGEGRLVRRRRRGRGGHASCASGGSPSPSTSAGWSTPTASATRSRAAPCRRRAGRSRSGCASTAPGSPATDWESYPILRFSETPAVDVVLLDRPDQPSLGVGRGVAGTDRRRDRQRRGRRARRARARPAHHRRARRLGHRRRRSRMSVGTRVQRRRDRRPPSAGRRARGAARPRRRRRLRRQPVRQRRPWLTGWPVTREAVVVLRPRRGGRSCSSASRTTCPTPAGSPATPTWPAAASGPARRCSTRCGPAGR